MIFLINIFVQFISASEGFNSLPSHLKCEIAKQMKIATFKAFVFLDKESFECLEDPLVISHVIYNSYGSLSLVRGCKTTLLSVPVARRLITDFGVDPLFGDGPINAAFQTHRLDLIEFFMHQYPEEYRFEKFPFLAHALKDGKYEYITFMDQWHLPADSLILDLAYRSILHERVDILRYLIEDLKLNPRTESDVLLFFAIELNKTSVAKHIIHWSSNVIFDNDEALAVASEKGNEEIVKFMLARGANVGANQNAPLTSAVLQGRVRVAEILLKGGANPNTNDGELLFYAVCSKNSDLVELLLKYGADRFARQGRIMEVGLNGRDRKIIALLQGEKFIDDTEFPMEFLSIN